MAKLTLLWPVVIVAGLVPACGPGDHATALFEVPGAAAPAGATLDGDYYALPFPNDLHRHADGSLDLADVPLRGDLPRLYRDAAATRLDGFGTNAAMFARFDAAIDQGSLPDPTASLATDASVYLVDVDAASPQYGVRFPVIATTHDEERGTIGAHSLAVRPLPGFPLLEHTTYALVVTSRVTTPGGNPVDASAAFVAARGTPTDPALVHAHDVYAPLWAYLDAGADAGGDQRADVVTAAVFTTQTFSRAMPALRRAVYALPSPVAEDVHQAATGTGYTLYDASYVAPNFQVGQVPYKYDGASGEILIGADGNAVVQRMEPMRLAVAVPVTTATQTMPATGWPIVIYQHGTGGDYHSFFEDGTARSLAAQGLAVVSTDQVLHGPRNPGGNPELDVFNFTNPLAARDNILQGATDNWPLLRAIEGSQFTDVGGHEVRFDPTRVYFYGHSQGGSTGPLFVAFEPTVGATVLSGAGGVLYEALLLKTEPIDIPLLIGGFLRDDPTDEDSPSMAIVQMYMEHADAVNYAPFIVRDPPPGPDGRPMAPKAVYQTEGFTDHYTPNLAIEAFATAIGGDVVATTDHADVPGLDLRGRHTLALPISGNLHGTTAVLAQFQQQADSDGHFVIFDLAVARQQAARFLGSLARTGTSTIP